MAIYHRTQRLQIYGDKPEVTQLFGGRYRMEVRCKAAKDTEAWYNDNKDQIFADFGTLYSAQMSVDGIDPRVGEAYANMVLTSNQASYTPTGEYVISFVYETLTDTFVQEADDKVDYEMANLRRVTRSVVANRGTSYNKVVGTSTIEHTEHGQGTITLTLASVEEDKKVPNSAGYTRLMEVWVESGTLSQSNDLVGSQKAIVIEAFGEVPATPSGFSLASKQESNYEGFQTNRFTFLKPSILSVQQDFNNGIKRVSVQAFNLDSAAVSTALSEVTVDHKLISTNESDYAGIKTTTFQYQIDESFTEDYELNGLKRISLIELSATNFTAQNVGSVSTTAPTTGLYLGTQSIDNGGIIKVRQSTWVESGTLSVSTRNLNEGVKQTTYEYLVIEGTPTGTIIGRRIDNFEGLKRITLEVLTSSDGTELTDGGDPKLNYQYQQLVPFTFPGVVDLVREQNHIFPSVRSPVEATVKADVYIYYQSSPSISTTDYQLQSAIDIWNPASWCQKISTIDSFRSDSGSVQPAYYNAQGIRGCRTRDSMTVTGAELDISAMTGNYTPADLQLEESTTVFNGKSTFTQTITYIYDVVTTADTTGGVLVLRGPYTIKGQVVVTMRWTGSQWELVYTDTITDPVSTDAATDNRYNFSRRVGAGEWSNTYTNATGTTSGTLATGSGGGTDPWDATWTGVTVKETSSSESFSAQSLNESVDFGIPAAGFWIEGRNVDNGATGEISIEGGPSNPLGKRYVLDVKIKKAFEDIDGNITWMKQVVVADCTPVSA